MTVTVLSVTRLNGLNDAEDFEIQLRVGDRVYVGKMKRDASSPIWNPDRVLSACLEGMPLAPKSIIGVLADVRSGKKISFPVELGDL